MQPTAEQIVRSLDDPEALEALFRRDPASFRDAFGEVSRSRQDATIVKFWEARLAYREPVRSLGGLRLWLAIGLGLLVGLLIRVPAIWLGEEWYFPRAAPSLVVLSLATYFWTENRKRSTLIGGLLLAVVSGVYVARLPELTDSVVMALIHLPILFWALVGFVFSGNAWREFDSRIRFLRYNGELLILASLVGLGGIVFSLITVALFELISHNSAAWYFQNIGVLGAAGIPVAATFLYDVVFKRSTGIAPVLAHVFSPLFLLMTCSYLVIAFLAGHNPFEDRNFLIIFNGLLLVVLGMTVFSIAERGERAVLSWIDYVVVALVFVTLSIDAIALSAVLFRLTTYGITPNRIVVLGTNLIVMTHLAWIARASIGLIRKQREPASVRNAVTAYLPVYVGWAVLVVFVLPSVFRFA